MSGILAWLMLVMESLCAAPLWAAAHALPEGDGLAGDHGRKGYLLFLGVLLRPPLMVFGFLMAMALLNGLGRVIGLAFSAFGFDYLSEGFLGISGFMAFAVILGIVVVTAAWKLFGLIGHLPDKVVGWIGASMHSFDERGEARQQAGSYREAGNLSSRMLDPVAKAERIKAKP
jgi:conjugal transfer/type IV secretion protein DotA/TraY